LSFPRRKKRGTPAEVCLTIPDFTDYTFCSGKNYGNLYYIPPTQEKEKEDARFSRKNEHRWRTQYHQEEKEKGTEKTERLNSGKTLYPLSRRGDFKKVFESGPKFSSKYLVVYARPNGLPFSRLGLSVSKKIGKAVVRNRIRRLLREALRKHLMEKSVRYDFVLVARSSSVQASFADFSREMSRVFADLGNEKDIDSNNKVV
jgi:ribonuclease P protein component